MSILEGLDSEAAILSRRIPAITSGIYFLIDGKEIVYVGQARNVHSRIFDHIRNRPRKKFDSYSYVLADESELNSLEVRYAYKFKPRYNSLSKGLSCKETMDECRRAIR